MEHLMVVAMTEMTAARVIEHLKTAQIVPKKR
jgi:hypothetical protein